MRLLLPSFAVLLFAAGCTDRPTAATAAADPRPVYDLPRLPDTLAIDGDTADWGTTGLGVTAFAEDALPMVRPEQFRAEVRLGWNARGMLAAVRLHSDQPWVEADIEQEITTADSVELFLRRGSKWRYLVQPVIAPGLAPGHEALISHVWDHRGTLEEWKGVPTALEVARKREADGATIEILVPWPQIRQTPVVGTVYEFTVMLNKVITNQGRRRLTWKGVTGETFQLLRLSETASSTIDRAAWFVRDGDNSDRLAVIATAPAAAAGEPVTLRRGGDELLRFPLQADGARAVGMAVATIPTPGDAPLVIGGTSGQLAQSKVPDVAQELRRTIEGAASRLPGRGGDDQRTERLRPRVPSLLTEAKLPTAIFPDPALARSAGVTSLEVRWFGADRKEVTVAERPGRYGAVITVAFATGKPVAFHQTVVRLPVEVPPASLTSDVLRRLGATVAPDAGSTPVLTGIGSQILDQRGLAVELAGLLEAAADGKPPHTLARDLSWWYALRTDLGTATTYQWFSLLPKGYEEDTTRSWPAVIFLHGGGEGNSVPFEKRNPESDLIGWAKDKNLPLAIYTLQSNGGWDPAAIVAALDRILTTQRIDPTRVVVYGFSMGSSGIYELVARYPERFAGAVPVSGRPNFANIPAIAGSIPLWVITGDEDNIAPLAPAQRYVKELKAAGGDVRLTVMPGLPHVGSQDASFAVPGLWEWILACRRPAAP